MTTTNTRPAVYVGTYAKYNEGNLAGKWISLDYYSNGDDFYKDCLELHKDEQDPELMFQDFEGFPREYYGESQLDPSVWEWVQLHEDQQEIVCAYLENENPGAEPIEALNAHAGTYDSPEDWAEEFLNDTGALNQIPEDLRMYFDYEAYARDAGVNMVSFCRHNGKTIVFHR